MNNQDELMEELLDRALAHGAVLTGKPDGTEPIQVIFSSQAWRSFSATLKPEPKKITPALAAVRKLEQMGYIYDDEWVLPDRPSPGFFNPVDRPQPQIVGEDWVGFPSWLRLVLVLLLLVSGSVLYSWYNP